MNEEKYTKLYMILVLLVTWSVTAVLFIKPSIGLEFFTLIMFIPGILAVIFNIAEYKSAKKVFECFTRKITVKAMLFSIFYPVIFVIICAVIAYVSGMASFHREAYINSFGQVTHDKILVIRDIVVFIIVTILTLPSTLGEEYGWRGYLLPKLTKLYGKVKATTIVGIVWGLFHVPAVFLLAKNTGMSNPLLLCIVQAVAAFTFSFPSSYSYYLSESIIPPMFIHAVWNSVNVMVLGDIYENEYGILKGNLLNINGEGILGSILGIVMIFGFIKIFKKGQS